MKGYTSMIDGHIDEAPEKDLVEVVRCKDCEYGAEEDDNIYSCTNFPDGIGGYISGDCFCSYGERKGQK